MSGAHRGGSHGCPGSDPGQELSPALTCSSRPVTVQVTADWRCICGSRYPDTRPPSLVLPLARSLALSEIPAVPATPAPPEIPASDWYTEFFTELPNEFWRRAAPPESAEADIDFVERQLGLSPGSRIVDVPCGSGRHSLALAARGHVVTGIDISTEAIAHARRAAADAGLDIDFGGRRHARHPSRQDVRRRDLYGQQFRLPGDRRRAGVPGRRRRRRLGPAAGW